MAISGATAPFANVFSAFSEGLEKGADATSVAPTGAAASAVGSETSEGLDTSTLLQALQSLESEGGQQPFSLFAKRLPGDPIASLASTVQLMKQGWVEFVGATSENSDVRLTALGREILTTLKESTAAA
jgi:hypothetical protein